MLLKMSKIRCMLVGILEYHLWEKMGSPFCRGRGSRRGSRRGRWTVHITNF